jgi:hypothetical protein
MENKSDEIVDAIVVERRTATHLLNARNELLKSIEDEQKTNSTRIKLEFVERFTKALLAPNITIPSTFQLRSPERYRVSIALCQKVLQECIPDPDNILECTFEGFNSSTICIDFRKTVEVKPKSCYIC